MRQIIFKFVLVFLLLGFTKSETIEPKTSILGTWELTEIRSVDGKKREVWIPVENDFQYTFNKDNTFTATRFSEPHSVA